MRKIISIDLDGTLLRSDKTVSRRTIDVLKECETQGHILVFNTARPPRTIPHLLPEEIKSEYLVCYNGAEIYCGKEKIYENCLPVGSVRCIIETINEKNPACTISLEINDVLYANQNIEKINGKIAYEIVDLLNMELKPAAKVLIDLEGIESQQVIIECIPNNCSIIVTDQGNLGQVMLNGVSKLEAIKHIVNLLGLGMSDVIAFGDDFNDLDIIKNSGTGVAMRNAVQEVKDIADFVTSTNDEEGVAEFLANYLLSDTQHTTEEDI